MPDHNLIGLLRGGPWALMPERLQALADAACAVHDGGAAVVQQEAAQRSVATRAGGSIVVLPVTGVLASRKAWWVGTTTEDLRQQVRSLAADDGVRAVVLDIDSPGGSVYGIPELSDDLATLRARKPLIAVANHLAASAAYWLASQAEEIWATPSADVGSIGVWTMHVDASKFYESLGFKITGISAGKYKLDGNDWSPLSEEAKEHLQAEVDATYNTFLAHVARGRGLTADVVREAYGEGRVYGAARAHSLGMVDAVGTLDQAIAHLANRLQLSATGRSQAEAPVEPQVSDSPAGSGGGPQGEHRDEVLRLRHETATRRHA